MWQYSLLVNYFTMVHSKYIKCEFIWVVKITNKLEAALSPQNAHWPSYLPRPYGQYDSLGEYCCPYTVSSVFLIVINTIHLERAEVSRETSKFTAESHTIL